MTGIDAQSLCFFSHAELFISPFSSWSYLGSANISDGEVKTILQGISIQQDYCHTTDTQARCHITYLNADAGLDDDDDERMEGDISASDSDEQQIDAVKVEKPSRGLGYKFTSPSPTDLGSSPKELAWMKDGLFPAKKKGDLLLSTANSIAVSNKQKTVNSGKRGLETLSSPPDRLRPR